MSRYEQPPIICWTFEELMYFESLTAPTRTVQFSFIPRKFRKTYINLLLFMLK